MRQHLQSILKNIFLIILFSLFIASCASTEDQSEEALEVEIGKAIPINEVIVELPERYGKELVQINCAPCHSLRYIEMQPELTRKSWDKIVQKMIKHFGAPIEDTLVSNQIVDYLYSIRGKK